MLWNRFILVTMTRWLCMIHWRPGKITKLVGECLTVDHLVMILSIKYVYEFLKMKYVLIFHIYWFPGESLLHILIICDTLIHTRIARLLLKVFPRTAWDMIEGIYLIFSPFFREFDTIVFFLWNPNTTFLVKFCAIDKENQLIREIFVMITKDQSC